MAAYERATGDRHPGPPRFGNVKKRERERESLDGKTRRRDALIFLTTSPPLSRKWRAHPRSTRVPGATPHFRRGLCGGWRELFDAELSQTYHAAHRDKIKKHEKI